MKKYQRLYDLDAPQTTLLHREIIQRKTLLKRLYLDWYQTLIHKSRQIREKGQFLEIGSGGGFLKTVFPEVITSDILDLPMVDIVCNAERLPFGNASLCSIMMVNVFHHIPRPFMFLREAERTLIPSGKILMIEPANSLLSRFIYRKFHHEPFDPDGAMEIMPGNPLSNSNQALPYIYFEREKESFAKNFPELKLSSIRYHTPFRYIVSGGLSMNALLPSFCYLPVKIMEQLLSPLSRQIGLFCSIDIEKRI
ncbi:MAG: class I SAM-dependent methyltransferase [Tannerella sp.]|jgi:SAM-dependent methyltransferase|nr:class I SAM-dependent methyltransferase [Tannerella sp.]